MAAPRSSHETFRPWSENSSSGAAPRGFEGGDMCVGHTRNLPTVSCWPGSRSGSDTLPSGASELFLDGPWSGNLPLSCLGPEASEGECPHGSLLSPHAAPPVIIHFLDRGGVEQSDVTTPATTMKVREGRGCCLGPRRAEGQRGHLLASPVPPRPTSGVCGPTDRAPLARGRISQPRA